jgi:predicted transcriptional regulator
MNSWLISIRPRFSRLIFVGEKLVELRRKRLHATPGDILFVYETSPTMSVCGFVRVKQVETCSVNSLWRLVGGKTAVTRSEYRKYFEGKGRATAIHVSAPKLFDSPLTLPMIRKESPLFHPPRTWMNFDGLPLPLQVQLRASMLETYSPDFSSLKSAIR